MTHHSVGPMAVTEYFVCRQRHSLIVMFCFAALLGCDRSTDPGQADVSVRGIFILNEGAYGAENAELSFYDPTRRTVEGNLYARANDGATLGDVANDMVVFEDRLFIVVNNSGRIDIVDIQDHRSLGRIALPGLPRRIAVVHQNKAYVTMQDSTVAIVDPARASYIRSVTTGPFPEGITVSGGFAFVMNSGFGFGQTISVIDARNDSVVADISTPFGPAFAEEGTDGKLYVVCTGRMDFGDPSNDTPGAVLKIDPGSLEVEDSLLIDGHPGKFALDGGGSMYLLGPGAYPATPVWKIALTPSIQPVSTRFVEGSFYGIGMHQYRRELYLADAGSFLTNGSVLVFGPDGNELLRLSSGIGIAPNGFVSIGD